MSLWAQTRQLPNELKLQLKSLYEDIFPFDIRYYLSGWIEENLVHTLDVDPEANDQHYHQLASNVLAEFVYEIERSATQFHDNLAMKASFMETANNLRQQFGPNPSALLKHLTRCLKYEISLIEILSKLMGLSAAVKINHTSVQELKNDYEQINQQKEELKQMAYVTNDPQEEALMDALLSDERERFNQNLIIVQNKKFQLINDINAVIEQMIHAYDLIVVQQLRQWKIDQRLAGNGAVFHNNLDTIQQWFEKLAENLRHTKTHIQMLYWGRQTIVLPLEASGHPDQLQPLEQRIDHLLVMLVTASFVIENQPPQVLKTNTKISPSVPVRVRVLTGRQLDIILDRKVHVSIVAEAEAQQIQATNNADVRTSGELTNNEGELKYDPNTNQLSACFRNMLLRNIKRPDKRGTESVMDEKFALLFPVKFKVGNQELSVWALSLPVVVIVHGNQEPQAWATITWDNAFSDEMRAPFQVPDRVQWPRLADALNMKFKHATGRGLTPDNLQFLCEKVCNIQPPNTVNPREQFIKWTQFCKDPVPETTFTFWEWFYAIMKLTREHLREPWQCGLIEGFVHKTTAQNKILICPPGTFLLRFSDSTLGGITVSWFDSAENKVLNLQPLLVKDLHLKSLPDSLRDLAFLLTLYPNVPKEAAFGRFYSAYAQNGTTRGRADGYVGVTNVITLTPPNANLLPTDHQINNSPPGQNGMMLSSDLEQILAEMDFTPHL